MSDRWDPRISTERGHRRLCRKYSRPLDLCASVRTAASRPPVRKNSEPRRCDASKRGWSRWSSNNSSQNQSGPTAGEPNRTFRTRGLLSNPIIPRWLSVGNSQYRANPASRQARIRKLAWFDAPDRSRDRPNRSLVLARKRGPDADSATFVVGVLFRTTAYPPPERLRLTRHTSNLKLLSPIGFVRRGPARRGCRAHQGQIGFVSHDTAAPGRPAWARNWLCSAQSCRVCHAHRPSAGPNWLCFAGSVKFDV
jgi:hypothetical protein